MIIENGEHHFEYDIIGDVDYSAEEFSCRVKGELQKKNDLTDDYEDLTEKDENELIKLLKDKKSEIIIAIYPAPENSDDYEDSNYQQKCDSDELSNCEGTLRIWNARKKSDFEVDFSFKTEFYGF